MGFVVTKCFHTFVLQAISLLELVLNYKDYTEICTSILKSAGLSVGFRSFSALSQLISSSDSACAWMPHHSDAESSSIMVNSKRSQLQTSIASDKRITGSISWVFCLL